jgi:hypothetical protein
MYILVGGYNYYGGTCWLSLQIKEFFFLEDGDSVFLHNISNRAPDYASSQPIGA